VQIFDLYSLEWSAKQLDDFPDYQNANLIVDNCQVIQTGGEHGGIPIRVFLVGGHFVSTDYQTRVSEYIPSENRLVERAPFNIKRTSFALCTLVGHLIYMVGGMEYIEG
jgi:hypothetical protein